jgi:hypothetical protein
VTIKTSGINYDKHVTNIMPKLAREMNPDLKHLLKESKVAKHGGMHQCCVAVGIF